MNCCTSRLHAGVGHEVTLSVLLGSGATPDGETINVSQEGNFLLAESAFGWLELEPSFTKSTENMVKIA